MLAKCRASGLIISGSTRVGLRAATELAFAADSWLHSLPWRWSGRKPNVLYPCAAGEAGSGAHTGRRLWLLMSWWVGIASLRSLGVYDLLLRGSGNPGACRALSAINSTRATENGRWCKVKRSPRGDAPDAPEGEKPEGSAVLMACRCLADLRRRRREPTVL